ncbi:hypothetical protein [Agrococcus jenensis]|uniref:hypothetical protein n=1 Tax=Agrococcus jenensis TaxID=46353 RepID=UPI0011CD838A|nr:hypothetical protein [Agrococcus jenensis]
MASTTPTPSPASSLQAGVAEAIDTWLVTLARAYESGDTSTAERALDRIALATRLGQRDLHRARSDA